MAIGAWEHNFPASKDVHPAYVDWPTVGYDILFATLLHEIFTALDDMQDALGYDITGAYDTLKAWLDALTTASHTQNTDKQIIDADEDSYDTVEKTADIDEAVTYLKNILVRKFHDDGILDLPKQSRCRVSRTTSVQPIATGSNIKVELNLEQYDNQNEFDYVTDYRFTAKKAGYYQVNANLYYATVVANERYFAHIYKNGGLYATSVKHSDSTVGFGPHVSDVVYLAANDFIELYAYHTAGVDQNLHFDRAYTYMSIHKLS